MTPEELARRIDLSALKPHITTGEIKALADAALKYPFATLCIPPCHVRLAAGLLKGSETGVSTVAGFPLGYSAAGVKEAEAARAVRDGASEVDMVMNISIFRSGDYNYVADEIKAVVRAAEGGLVKVIIETSYLTDDEKARAVDIVAGAGASFVKTSTGFGPRGATARDVKLLRKKAAGRIGVKAAGGIRTLDDALSMIEAGAGRLGTSAGLSIIEEFLSRKKIHHEGRDP